MSTSIVVASLQGSCFGHMMSKMCQYATNNYKVFVGLILVNVKLIQVGFKKYLCGQKKEGNDAKVGKNMH